MSLPAPTIDAEARYGLHGRRPRVESDPQRAAKRLVGASAPPVPSAPSGQGLSMLSLRAGTRARRRRR